MENNEANVFALPIIISFHFFSYSTTKFLNLWSQGLEPPTQNEVSLQLSNVKVLDFNTFPFFKLTNSIFIDRPEWTESMWRDWEGPKTIW